jgi:hypothetical protein
MSQVTTYRIGGLVISVCGGGVCWPNIVVEEDT